MQVSFSGGKLVGEVFVLLAQAAYLERVAHKAGQEDEYRNDNARKEGQKEYQGQRAAKLVGKKAYGDGLDVL